MGLLRKPSLFIPPNREWALGMVREWRMVRHGWKILLRRNPKDAHFQARFEQAGAEIRSILKRAREASHAG